MPTVAIIITNFLLGAGIILSMVAPTCTEDYPEKYKNVFGISLHQIGIFGYSLMAGMFNAHVFLNAPYFYYGFTVIGATVLTLFLIVESLRHKFDCMICPSIWIINCILTLASILGWKTTT